MTMIADPNPDLEPWSFDGGPKLPAYYLSPAEMKRTGHLFKGCPNPTTPKSDKKNDVEPCTVCLLVKKACDHEVNLWREIQEQKAKRWRNPDLPTVALPVASARVEPADDDEADEYIPPAPSPSNLATEKQVALLVRLAAEKTPEWFNRVGEAGVTRRAQERTKADASAAIEKLMAMPTINPDKQMKRGPVKAGHYALPTGEGATNSVAFYRVDVPTEGKWAGYTFVKQVIGGQDPVRVPRHLANSILARIKADPEAGPRYGKLIGKCCRCNRTLTNDESRALGIGPECLSKGM